MNRSGQARMKKEVVIPRLGSSDESDEVKVLRWLKQKGDRVKAGEPLLEVETDKVNVEIEAPDSGLLSEVLAKEGEVVSFNLHVDFVGLYFQQGFSSFDPISLLFKPTQDLDLIALIARPQPWNHHLFLHPCLPRAIHAATS